MSCPIPKGWALGSIADIADVNPPGSTVTADDSRLVTFLPMVAVEELSGKIDVTAERPFREVKKNFTRFRNNDVLFAKITPSMENGKVAVARDLRGGIGCGTTEFHVIRPATDVAPDYMRLFLVQSRYRYVAKRNMQGAVGQQRVPADFVRESAIPVAPANEQRRIVSKIDELFSRIDEGEQALKRVEKLVERYRQSVLKAAVTGELTRDWRAARKRAGGPVESGAALLARILEARRTAWEAAELAKMNAKRKPPTDDRWKQKYKEPQPPDTTDLPELPEGWVWASMDQLSRSSSYGTSTKCVYDGVGVPVLRIPNIRGGHLDFSDIKRANTDICTDADDLLSYGDLLVVRTNGSASLIGVGCVVTEPTPMPCYFASYLIRFRLALPTALSAWITLCWQSHVVRKFVGERKATSAGQYNISQSSLMELCLPLAPLAEMQEVVTTAARVASEADSAQACSINERRRSSALRQSILKAAFSGQLVPQDPSEEPAAKLLERIAAERAAAPAIRKRKKKSA